MLPLRRVEYLAWVTMVPGTTAASSTTVYLPTTIYPLGHVVCGNFDISNLVYEAVTSRPHHGHLTIGLYRWPIGSVNPALIQDGGQTHWYVTMASREDVTNTPTVVYWTAP